MPCCDVRIRRSPAPARRSPGPPAHILSSNDAKSAFPHRASAASRWPLLQSPRPRKSAAIAARPLESPTWPIARPSPAIFVWHRTGMANVAPAASGAKHDDADRPPRSPQRIVGPASAPPSRFFQGDRTRQPGPGIRNTAQRRPCRWRGFGPAFPGMGRRRLRRTPGSAVPRRKLPGLACPGERARPLSARILPPGRP